MVITVCQMPARHAACEWSLWSAVVGEAPSSVWRLYLQGQTLSRVLHVEIAEGHVIEAR